MSYTIITSSGSDFSTNINAEILLGILCKEAGVKYFDQNSVSGFINKNLPPKLAYRMSKSEAEEASEGMIKLIERAEELFPKVSDLFEPGTTVEGFKKSLVYYSNLFADSEGYEAI